MVLDAVSNFVRGNTDAEVGAEDTTVSVDDASFFPDPETDGEFNVVIWDVNNFPRPDQDGDVEIMRVTARDTDTNELTVTRGQEMTSEEAHPEGSAIHLSPTAKMFSDIESTFGDFWDAGTEELTADVNNTNTTTTSLEAQGAVIGETYHFASKYDGDNADNRLDNALSSASVGDIIYLENENYTTNRTISKRNTLIGCGIQGGGSDGTVVDADWVLDARVLIISIGAASEASISINELNTAIERSQLSGGTTVTISADQFRFSNNYSGDLTFESGTSNGLVDSCVGTSVTDNGSNTIGDIA